MILATVNFKGGQGKTTWAAILAAWLGDDVEILDLDYRQGDSLAWAGRANRPARAVRPEEAETVLRAAAAIEDWVVVDCPPGEQKETYLVLQLASMLVVPVTPSGFQDASAWGRMRDVLQEAQHLNPGMKVAAILNATRATGLSKEFLEMLQAWHAPREGRAVMGAVPMHVALAEAYGAGQVPSSPSVDAVLHKLELFAKM